MFSEIPQTTSEDYSWSKESASTATRIFKTIRSSTNATLGCISQVSVFQPTTNQTKFTISADLELWLFII